MCQVPDFGRAVDAARHKRLAVRTRFNAAYGARVAAKASHFFAPATSQRSTRPSLAPVASRLPSPVNRNEYTQPSLPGKIRAGCARSGFRRSISPSELPTANVAPFGANVTAVTAAGKLRSAWILPFAKSQMINLPPAIVPDHSWPPGVALGSAPASARNVPSGERSIAYTMRTRPSCVTVNGFERNVRTVVCNRAGSNVSTRGGSRSASEIV